MGAGGGKVRRGLTEWIWLLYSL